jgi:hypothetical protein
VPLETTSQRLWKRLSREDRMAAASAFWEEPPQEMVGVALGVIATARRMRPQAARALTEAARAQALATILDPGELLAASLLVSLHLGSRRALLAAFLDALGLPHENGVLKDEADGLPPPTADAVARAVAALGSFPSDQIRTYLNTLWLQDPERWAALPDLAIS